MNTITYIFIVLALLVIYILFAASSTKKIKTEIAIDEREIPPTILKTAIIENNLFYTETRDDREVLFTKSYMSFKSKHSEKIHEQNQMHERRVNKVVENNTKKMEAVQIIDKVQMKKNALARGLQNLQEKTGNAD